ncbi:MAG TPA: hypothetical protein VFO85_02315, partial [Vicinamibacteria bacterium]|nr:hypothetical protein [Vicinamibacteria bacterium]
MSERRLLAIREVTSRRIRTVPEAGGRVLETFGCNTFGPAVMKEKLPRPVYQSLQETVRRGARLDPSIA